jgi:hypothetical protein
VPCPALAASTTNGANPSTTTSWHLILGNQRFHIPPVAIINRKRPFDVEPNIIAHPIHLRTSFGRIVRQLPPLILPRQILVQVKRAHVFDKQGLRPVRPIAAQDTHNIGVLRQRADGIAVAEAEFGVFEFGLVVAEVVVLGEVVEGEGGAVFEEAEEGVEERHVHVDVFADVAVVAGGGRGTVHNVLDFVVLGKV